MRAAQIIAREVPLPKSFAVAADTYVCHSAYLSSFFSRSLHSHLARYAEGKTHLRPGCTSRHPRTVPCLTPSLCLDKRCCYAVIHRVWVRTPPMACLKQASVQSRDQLTIKTCSRVSYVICVNCHTGDLTLKTTGSASPTRRLSLRCHILDPKASKLRLRPIELLMAL